jgi:hypothetical protein
MSANFIVLRRESVGGYSSRGPIAQPMTLKESRAEIVRLKKDFPHQDFVIMGEVGEVTRSERVTVRMEAPDLSDAIPKKRKPRKVAAPQDAESWNVVPLRKEETG